MDVLNHSCKEFTSLQYHLNEQSSCMQACSITLMDWYQEIPPLPSSKNARSANHINKHAPSGVNKVSLFTLKVPNIYSTDKVEGGIST